MSVQFSSLPAFQHVHVGLLWERFSQEYPGPVEYHPPLAPVFETFGLPGPGMMQFQVNFAPDIPRVWFKNASSDQVLQFQRDRLVHNWRKVGGEDEYPRYEAIRAHFVEDLRKIDAFLREYDIGSVTPNQCELTYVNIIKLHQDCGDQTADILRPWRNIEDPRLGRCEDVAFTARYLLTDADVPPTGRLTVQLVPGIDQVGDRIVQLSLLARGPPLDATIEAALDFMDVARSKIVHSFAALTTEPMHHLWGRIV